MSINGTYLFWRPCCSVSRRPSACRPCPCPRTRTTRRRRRRRRPSCSWAPTSSCSPSSDVSGRWRTTCSPAWASSWWWWPAWSSRPWSGTGSSCARLAKTWAWPSTPGWRSSAWPPSRIPRCTCGTDGNGRPIRHLMTQNAANIILELWYYDCEPRGRAVVRSNRDGGGRGDVDRARVEDLWSIPVRFMHLYALDPAPVRIRGLARVCEYMSAYGYDA